MKNGKVTLAELRREAKRVGLVDGRARFYDGMTEIMGRPFVDIGSTDSVDMRVFGDSRMNARRRMLKLLRALPDGALKEG